MWPGWIAPGHKAESRAPRCSGAAVAWSSSNLKQRAGVHAALSLVETADVVLGGFHSGVTGRIGLGPHDWLAWNSWLACSGPTSCWQERPHPHDLTYLAATEALCPTGTAKGRSSP